MNVDTLGYNGLRAHTQAPNGSNFVEKALTLKAFLEGNPLDIHNSCVRQ